MKSYNLKFKIVYSSFIILYSLFCILILAVLLLPKDSLAADYTVRSGHPRIYITPDNIDAIRARCAGNPGPEDGIQDDYYRNLKNWGDKNIATLDMSIQYSGIKYAFLVQMGEIPGNTYTVTYGGQTGIVAYTAKGIEILKNKIGGIGIWGSADIPPTLMMYDWLYDKMTPEDRKYIIDKLIEKIEAYIQNMEAYGWRTDPLSGMTMNEHFAFLAGLAFYGDGTYIGDGSNTSYYNNKAKEYCDTFVTNWKDWMMEARLRAFKVGYTYGQYGTSEEGTNAKLWALHLWYTATDDRDIKIYDELKNLPLFYMHNLIPYKVPLNYWDAKSYRDTGDGLVRFGDDAGFDYGGPPNWQYGIFQSIARILYRWTGGLAMAEDMNDSYLNNLMWYVRYHVTRADNDDPLPCSTCPGHPYDISDDSYKLVYDIITRNEDIQLIQPTELTHVFGATNTGPAYPEQGWDDGTPEGVGIVTMRTAWEDPNATLVWYKASPYKTWHHHENEGSFQIYKKGWLAIDSGNYEDNTWDSQYSRRTIAHNAMTIYRPGEWTPGPGIGFSGGPNDAGQRVVELSGNLQYLVPTGWNFRGGIKRFESKPNQYDYIHSDITRAHNSTYYVDYTDHGNQAKISLVQRDLVFLRPDYVVIFDRVNSTNSEYPKRWLLHSVYRPKLNGTENFSGIIPYSTNIPGKLGGVALQGNTTAGISESYNTDTIQIEGWKSNETDFRQPAPGPSEGRLFTKTLLPKQHITRIVGGYDGVNDYRWMDAEYNNYTPSLKHGPIHEFWGSWRVEIEPTGSDYPKNYNTFLNVLYPTDNSTNQMPATQLIESTSGQEMQGAFIQGNSPNQVVMFAKNNEEISSTSFIIPSTGQTEVLIVDLTPNTNYYYKVNGQTIEVSKTNNGGTLKQSSNQGTLNLLVTGSGDVVPPAAPTGVKVK